MAQLERSYSILLAWFRLDLNQRSSGYEPDGDSELPYGTPSAYLLVQRTSVILALSCDQLPPTELPTVVSRCSSRTRTDTGPILSRLPLPIGLRGRSALRSLQTDASERRERICQHLAPTGTRVPVGAR